MKIKKLHQKPSNTMIRKKLSFSLFFLGMKIETDQKRGFPNFEDNIFSKYHNFTDRKVNSDILPTKMSFAVDIIYKENISQQCSPKFKMADLLLV